MPTQPQIANAANPQAFNVNIPGEGQIWRDAAAGGYSNIFYQTGGKVYYLNPSDPSIVPNASQYAYQRDGANIAGVSTLQSQYGIDYNNIAKMGYNQGDLRVAGYEPQQGSLAQLQSLYGKPAGADSSKTLNGPGTGGTPLPQGTPTPLAPGTAPAAATPNLGANGQANTPSGTAPVAAKTPPNVALQPGNTGDSVKQLQDYLVAAGYMTQDQVNTGYGTYGPQTTAAVLAMQQKLGVDNTTGPGYFGPKTIAALSAAGSGPGSTNNGSPAGATPSVTPTAATTSATDPYAGLDPISKQVKMYSDAATSLGLPTVKSQLDDVMKQQADLTNELNGKLADIQNNPWYSQSVVNREQQRLKDKYATKLDTLTNLANLYDSIYKQGQAQVNSVVSGAIADQNNINELAQKQLDAAAALQKDNQIASVGGREVLVNKATGKVVADLGPTTQSSSASTKGTVYSGGLVYTPADQSADSQALEASRGSDGYVDPTVYQNLYKAWVANGGSLTDFLQQYPPKNYVNPDNTWLPTYLMPASASTGGLY